ncbi:MAG: hypothetical protein WC960_02350 [Bacteroidales bacterium]
MLKRVVVISSIFLLSITGPLHAQSTLHLVGIKSGITLAGLNTHPDLEYKSVASFGGYGVEYTYYHTLWGDIKLFGLKTGIYKDFGGYVQEEGENRFETITIPLISQFHYDFWKMRALVNIGAFGGVRQNMSYWDGRGFDNEDNRVDLGFVAGGGLAFIFSPFELHIEGNWFYSLSYMHSPNKYDDIYYLFTHPKRLVISAALYLQFGKGRGGKN